MEYLCSEETEVLEANIKQNSSHRNLQKQCNFKFRDEVNDRTTPANFSSSLLAKNITCPYPKIANKKIHISKNSYD